jgi:urease accessory protein
MPTITTDEQLPRLRLLQLVSPSLPVGAFTYSQGMEWAVECGWVRDAESLQDWIESLLESSMTYLEIPLLKRLHDAAARADNKSFSYWSHYLAASRETRELRLEERNRGRGQDHPPGADHGTENHRSADNQHTPGIHNRPQGP